MHLIRAEPVHVIFPRPLARITSGLCNEEAPSVSSVLLAVDTLVYFVRDPTAAVRRSTRTNAAPSLAPARWHCTRSMHSYLSHAHDFSLYALSPVFLPLAVSRYSPVPFWTRVRHARLRSACSESRRIVRRSGKGCISARRRESRRCPAHGERIERRERNVRGSCTVERPMENRALP